jgi:hypothetical protein
MFYIIILGIHKNMYFMGALKNLQEYFWRFGIVFFVFTSRLISLLPLIKVCDFLYGMYDPIDPHHWHRPTDDVSHLISVPPRFPGTS